MTDPDTLSALIDVIQRFVAERLRPIEGLVSETDEVPGSIIEEMKQLGLFGLSIPESYGGLGLSLEEEARVIVAFCHTAPAFRSTFGTNVGIGSQGLVMFGDEAQKARWLPSIASGETITAFALTEAEAGSDSASVQTRAVRDGDHYVLNGVKRYITNAGRANLFTVMARTDPNTKGGAGVSAFLVPADLPGLSVGKPEKKMGQQGAHIHDVVFEDVRVPVENRLGAEGEGFTVAMRVLDRGRVHISAVCVGVAERLIADCVAYASERKQFGQPIASFQLIQAMIADSKTEALAAKALVFDTARKRDAGANVTLEAAATKLFASEMVGRVADRAVQVFGGAGYVADYGIERLYRDVRIFRIYEGASQIQQLIIARETLKRGG
ncbi:acyl-CoA dehydrogenase family protein [Caulobacter vibrioides]|uniref:Acyl-CoA dehydrogenase n=2 Tax=Caulobacter vibrioides TaxID=155892 RepID=Q9A7C6_CAUVC|nr:acyl-CoA dehydrogenase family protein [Caulobacter vibrioides]YP_002517248.1 acyl-CoA dehydrogenase, short-chain specific [Caulobacter vibrioides NA1000]AAK23774.1 acyl-CoA dehydrogenase [Caulobacter vibrioides CB15]ACL95340.1 acyl-CoA dehydrogenase, short-chain specific [Caulobacter vibrioides NA1000]ATC28674.1 acyl-CoA dehydrogenase [Caulobacter vibrioides]QXZ53854.1 acyl-CoA dehydrogenase family protein [Caulobacter vibrioides]